MTSRSATATVEPALRVYSNTFEVSAQVNLAGDAQTNTSADMSEAPIVASSHMLPREDGPALPPTRPQSLTAFRNVYTGVLGKTQLAIAPVSVPQYIPIQATSPAPETGQTSTASQIYRIKRNYSPPRSGVFIDQALAPNYAKYQNPGNIVLNGALGGNFSWNILSLQIGAAISVQNNTYSLSAPTKHYVFEKQLRVGLFTRLDLKLPINFKVRTRSDNRRYDIGYASVFSEFQFGFESQRITDKLRYFGILPYHMAGVGLSLNIGEKDFIWISPYISGGILASGNEPLKNFFQLKFSKIMRETSIPQKLANHEHAEPYFNFGFTIKIPISNRITLRKR